MPVDKDVLREQIHKDLQTLVGIEGQAVRWNKSRRAERQFWTGLLVDVAEVALPFTLSGRIALRFIRRVAARERLS
jgi:hypothetical protein